MADPALPKNLASRIADVRRRISDLERASGLPQSSMDTGSLVIRDGSGNTVGRLGTTDPLASGINLYSAQGQRIFGMGANGTVPDQLLAFTPGAAYDGAWPSTNSGTYVTGFGTSLVPVGQRCSFSVQTFSSGTSPASVVRARVLAGIDSASTEVWVSNDTTAGGGLVSFVGIDLATQQVLSSDDGGVRSPVALPAGLGLAMGTPLTVAVQWRIVSGVGNARLSVSDLTNASV